MRNTTGRLYETDSAFVKRLQRERVISLIFLAFIAVIVIGGVALTEVNHTHIVQENQ